MRTPIALVFVFFSIFSFAQAPTLVVEGTAPNLYITHTVAPKESLYSLARLYNLPPATLATFNGTNLQTGLKIGQSLKVPLTEQNFDQQGQKEGGETLVPVYHVVVKSETLSRVANNHNKVPLTAIKDWNNLQGESLEPGSPLVVGHLKIKNEQLSLLGAAIPAGGKFQQVADVQPATESAPKQNTFNPLGTTPENETAVPPTAAVEEKQTAPQQAEVQPTQQVITEKKPAQNINDIVEKKAETPAINTTTEKKPDLLAPTKAGTPDEGFFAPGYTVGADDKTMTENSGEAGTFKSTSGWQDKKYYVLMNNVEPGTIVKIAAADKVVFAKVLGSLPETKGDQNMLLRVSNAAASYLGKIDPKFAVQVSYYK